MAFPLMEALRGLTIRRSTEEVIGVDIGSSAIKVIQARREKERAILETYGEAALGPYGLEKESKQPFAIGQAVQLENETLAEILSDLMKASSARAKTAAVAIPLKSSFATMISLPATSDKELASVVELEARRYIPLPIHEVYLDWWRIPTVRRTEEEILAEGEAPSNKADIMLLATHKDVISKYKSIITGAGLTPKVYETEPVRLVRASIGRETSPVAVLDIGATSTKLSVVDRGIIRYTHMISRGSQDLSIALAQSFGISFEDAEEKKRSEGLTGGAAQNELRQVIGPALDFIFFEVQNTIKDYQKKASRAVGKVILSGGGALLKGLVPYAGEKLSLEVVIADPFSRLEYPAFLESALETAGPSFAVAIGLALRGLE